MTNHSSGVSSTVKVVVGFVLFLIFIAGFTLYSYFSYGTKAVNMEQNMIDTQKEAKNVLSSCTGTMSGILKLPNQYHEGFGKLIQVDHNGRYGKDTVARVTQFMQERQLNYNDKFLTDVSNTLKACEASFATKQSIVNSHVSTYKRQLDNPWSGMFYRFHGYPKIKLSDFEMVLHTGVQEQFDTKVRKRFDEN